MQTPDSLESLWLLVADLRLAVEEEIEAVTADLVRRGLDRPVPALSGRSRGEAGTGYRYAFQIAGGMYDIRADDRVRIHAGGRDALGVVHCFDRTLGLLQAVSPEWLGERLDGAELEFDPTWLLRELSLRLAEVAEDPDEFFPETVLEAFGRLPPRLGRDAPQLASSEDLNGPQRDALERVLGSSAQLVWGPPGTGKSRLVARAALELARRGRVLVAATTNGAVDEIARRLASIADPALLDGDRIIRVGFDLGGAPKARIDFGAAVARRIEGGAGGVDRTLADLEGRFGAPARPGAIAGAGKRGDASALNPYARAGRLLSLARSRGDAEAARTLGRALLEITRQAERVLEEADIVLTTFARLSIREELRRLRFESLLIDEASTAPLPYVALAASRVAGPAIAVGDFQQLPPVVTSTAATAERWLRTDLFREVGVVDDARDSGLPSASDGLCAMLDLQYRMAPGIRELVSEFFYGGRLRDAPEVRDRPTKGRPVTVLDTSGLDPRVERADGSRRNRTHAEVVADFLAQAARDGFAEIAVVCPYRAQTRQLRDLVRRRLGRAAPADLQISTIHRFQGQEKRLVVIDTVDAPPGRSWFLDERRNRDFPRLLNVALSRARERLVIVATVSGLRRTLPADALLNRLLEHLARSGSRVSARPADLWSGR
ncbi:DEAD/DEAH box helicase [Candidatus Palauibacter sp.]|uniref:DEAD/DEAH box helicase n=1 Tax=Candidatus Palauibacter sp. TaxID=3101350 RepID=UPI003B59D49A